LNTPSKVQSAEQQEYSAITVALIFEKRAANITECDCEEFEPKERAPGTV